jgi:hypothetical protein
MPYFHARTRLYFFSSRLGHFQMPCLRQWRFSVVAHTPSRAAASRSPRLKHDCSGEGTLCGTLSGEGGLTSPSDREIHAFHRATLC